MATATLLPSSSLLSRDRTLSSSSFLSSPIQRSSRCHVSLSPSTRSRHVISRHIISRHVIPASSSTDVTGGASGESSSDPIPKSPKSSPPMRRRQLFQLGGAAAMSLVCPGCGVARAEEWGYGTLAGPGQWGNVCATGTRQSPIDMPRDSSGVTSVSDFGEIRFLYGPEAPSFYNTGHGTMQVDFLSGANRVQVGNRTLDLLQYHFHAPSEHSFGGQRAAMEAHLVHRDSTGKLAVIGVMLAADPRAFRNPCLQAGLEFGPDVKTKRVPAPVSCFFRPDPKQRLCPSLEIHPGMLLPEPDQEGKHKYMNYSGSLTTPPCSEGVDWFLLATPLKIPGEQVVEFMTYVGEKRTLSLNSRPVQPLNDRVISIGP